MYSAVVLLLTASAGLTLGVGLARLALAAVLALTLGRHL